MRTLILLALLGYILVEGRKAKLGYKDSFTYATFRNIKSGKERTVCANYLQYKQHLLAANQENAVYYPLRWWQDKPNNTKVCPISRSDEFNYKNSIVPLNYRITDDNTNCTRRFSDANFRYAAQYEVDQLRESHANASLLLLDKGRQFVIKWRDFLFSDFFDPYINVSTAIPTFFMYSHILNENIEELGGIEESSHIQIGFHRPEDSYIDGSMVIIWLLAMICVGGGGLWAFHRHKLGKDKPTLPVQNDNSGRPNNDSGIEISSGKGCCTLFCNRYSNSIAIIILMAFLVTVLMTGFYFRPVLVGVFNILVTILGSISVFKCLRAFLSNFTCLTERKFYQAKLWLPAFINLNTKTRPSYVDAIFYLLSLTMCVCWYIYRREPYAFILLDIINVTLCLHILKSLRLPSVKWISCLMACMFIYDAIMVFVTPVFTSNGCSVMLEVATGIDCSSNSVGYPMPPVDAIQPEKFPMLMQVMPFDSMTDCMDLYVETGYPMTILGLGDIIIPGYLVTHCFTMAGFTENVRLLYGFVCIIGYGLGLIITFVALTLMYMAQPALIYLVPCTLIPIYVLALCRGEFRRLWSGVQEEEKEAISDTETVHLSSDEASTSPIAEL